MFVFDFIVIKRDIIRALKNSVCMFWITRSVESYISNSITIMSVSNETTHSVISSYLALAIFIYWSSELACLNFYPLNEYQIFNKNEREWLTVFSSVTFTYTFVLVGALVRNHWSVTAIADQVHTRSGVAFSIEKYRYIHINILG